MVSSLHSQLAWRITSEDFMKEISNLWLEGLRVGYGEMGNSVAAYLWNEMVLRFSVANHGNSFYPIAVVRNRGANEGYYRHPYW
jgi:hypothetical protein